MGEAPFQLPTLLPLPCPVLRNMCFARAPQRTQKYSRSHKWVLQVGSALFEFYYMRYPNNVACGTGILRYPRVCYPRFTLSTVPRNATPLIIRAYIPRYPRFFQFIFQNLLQPSFSNLTIFLFFITVQINFSFKDVLQLFFYRSDFYENLNIYL